MLILCTTKSVNSITPKFILPNPMTLISCSRVYWISFPWIHSTWSSHLDVSLATYLLFSFSLSLVYQFSMTRQCDLFTNPMFTSILRGRVRSRKRLSLYFSSLFAHSPFWSIFSSRYHSLLSNWSRVVLKIFYRIPLYPMNWLKWWISLTLTLKFLLNKNATNVIKLTGFTPRFLSFSHLQHPQVPPLSSFVNIARVSLLSLSLSLAAEKRILWLFHQ